jgi:peptide/nickel transport system ATP-binding protein
MLGRYPHQLSGGQQQRVMTAMALAAEPEILIADEPTSALDATVQAEILALLRRVQERLGTAILFITHDLAAAARLSDHVVVMQSGRIVEQGPVQRIMASPEQAYTRELVSVRRMLETPPPLQPGRRERDIILHMRGVSYAYPARSLLERPFPALIKVSLQLEAGKTLGILGESGSGKSTLASLIAGLASASGGEIRLFGEIISRRGYRMPRSLRRRCQIVFQNPFGALNPRLTIEKAMREPIELLEPENAGDIRPRLEQALLSVGLEPAHLERYPHQLSGGQRQRVCIARALLSGPDLLICDEIVSALDATVQMQVLQTLKALQEERGFAMLFIGHDIEIVRWVSDSIAVMNRGRIVEQGSAVEVLDSPQDAYTRRLISSMPAPLRLSAV